MNPEDIPPTPAEIDAVQEKETRLARVQNVMASIANGEMVDPHTIDPREHCSELITWIHMHRKRGGPSQL